VYVLTLDPLFAPFLADGTTWQKKTAANRNRGLQDDAAPIPAANRRTAAEKNASLDLMLGQIANFCPVIARNAIVKNATSVSAIWQQIRQHFGFQSSGAHFLDLATIKLNIDERPEDLYQRLLAFFEDNLLTTGGGITHHGEVTDVDEDLTPSLENTVVCLWLQLIRPGLPQLVKQKYGAELRNKTLASLRPEISAALDSLIEELNTTEDAKILRTFSGSARHSATKQQVKTCTLCKAAGRPSFNSHFISECKFLPPSDRRAIARSRLTQDVTEDSVPVAPDNSHDELEPLDPYFDTPSVRRVSIVQSPFLNAFFHSHPIRLTLDSGATTNMVKSSAATRIGLPITPASQMARQADGCTPLAVVGETHCLLTRGPHTFQLDALVVDKLDVDFLAGSSFMERNDVGLRIAKRQVVIAGKESVFYGEQQSNQPTVRRTQSYLIRAPERQTVVLPGDYIEAQVPSTSPPDLTWTLEPRHDASGNRTLGKAWPSPQEVSAIDHHIRITNTTPHPILLRKGEHFGQVNEVHVHDEAKIRNTVCVSRPIPTASPHSQYSESVVVDPDNILPSATRAKFQDLHRTYNNVFNPSIAKYNGASGNIEGQVNMGPVQPPQRKGRLPVYNRSKLDDLQRKFDELEESGVFAKPEQVGISVEYLNLSFLVQKPSGGSRLVTAFGEVGQYAKPQPSLMPNIDGTLRDIARWKYIVKSDLLKSFYQIPLAKSSMKYCGVVTPFKGVRVYTRCAMGMPGSETCLEELMSRVLGELIQEGIVAKLADDLYCGGNTPEELLTNWSRVLEAIHKNNLRLSATKTIVSPRSTTILGWVWSDGTLRASAHRTAALSAVTPPTTVKGLRSFIGAYKVLSRVLKGYAELLHPLDAVVAGKQSRESIQWSDELLQAFKQAQQALTTTKTITLPRPEDELWIVTDGSVKNRGIGATLYILRDKSLLLAGFFNAKIKPHQVTWLPCEVEALCIGAAIRHFAPYSIQSVLPTQVLTDSRPCVQAYQRLCRGEFSNSARVTTFLSMLSRYQARLSHISGVANLASDFASRNPIECTHVSCQVCQFIHEAQDEVVRSLAVKDVTDGLVSMPFTSRPAWKATQLECSDLRRVHSHLTQGTRPTKKMTSIPDVKKYLKSVTVAADGLLIVKLDRPFQPTRERIVLPRNAIFGLLTAVHLKFHHPSAHQLKQLISRYFFALDLDNAVLTVVNNCHHCSSLKTVPTRFREQSTSDPPDFIGSSFAADVMRRCKQMILVLRETVSSFTLTMLINSEKHEDLLTAMLSLASSVRPLGEHQMSIRVDNAPGFRTLACNPLMTQHNLQLVLGHVKNVNKNPVAERAIEELGRELLHIAPEGGAVSALTLSLATANMNSRIRSSGMSAREVWTQRDQVSGDQLPVEDRKLMLDQHALRKKNHTSSATSKAHGKGPSPIASFQIGDLVYLSADREKTKARDKYMVVECSVDQCKVRKFTQAQFRTRDYSLKSSDIYHVLPTTLPTVPGPIRGLESDELDLSSDSSDEHGLDSTDVPPTHQDRRDDHVNEPAINQDRDHNQPVSSVIPSPVRDLILHSDQQPDNPISTPEEAPLECSALPASPVVTTRQSSRKTAPPKWLSKDHWILDD
jgi:hypothetical protein